MPILRTSAAHIYSIRGQEEGPERDHRSPQGPEMKAGAVSERPCDGRGRGRG